MKGIYFESYWMDNNDIVFLMAQDLKDLCELTIVDTGIYSGNKENWYIEDHTFSQNRPIRWLIEVKILELVKRFSYANQYSRKANMKLLPDSFKFIST